MFIDVRVFLDEQDVMVKFRNSEAEINEILKLTRQSFSRISKEKSPKNSLVLKRWLQSLQVALHRVSWAISLELADRNQMKLIFTNPTETL